MAQRVYPLGQCQAGSGAGCLFVCDGAAPNAGVEWTLTGNGTLTPTASVTDRLGVATAVYTPTGASAGDTITVQADVYA